MFLLERVCWEFWDRDSLVLYLSEKLHHHRCQIIQRLCQNVSDTRLNSEWKHFISAPFRIRTRLCKNKLWIIQQNDKEQDRSHERFSNGLRPNWEICCALQGAHWSLHLLSATFRYKSLRIQIFLFFIKKCMWTAGRLQWGKCSLCTSEFKM